MPNTKRFLRVCILIWVTSIAAGCSTLSSLDDPNKHHSTDPFEGVNRSIYAFNTAADNRVLRPVAKAYSNVVPRPARIGVRNFFFNLNEPLYLVNNLLQGKGNAALASGYRFILNSTVGLLGFIDIAKLQDINRQPEDFGQTLAAWGVKPGPYLLVPFIGPTNLRDGLGAFATNTIYYPVGQITDDNTARIALPIINIINQRSLFLSADRVFEEQIDPYEFSKSLYEYNRVRAIYDGQAPKAQIDIDIDDF